MANNWAIAVGINNYDFLPNTPLKFAQADALEMRRFLCEEAGFGAENVLLCGDGAEGTKRATRSQLRHILKYELQRAQNADNLWFFFSGHGMAGSDGQDYLMTIDGNPEDLHDTAISIHFVTDRLRACQAKNIVLILDMCRNESRDEGRKSAESMAASLRDLVKDREGQQGIITLFSCGRGESSYEIAELGQGAFTYALLEGLKRHTILKDLEGYLARRVPELHRNAGKVRKQIPLAIPEPGWKYEEPILTHYATDMDVARLQMMAIDAEIKGDFGKAIELWAKVNELSQKSDERNRAIQKIIDLTRRSHQPPTIKPEPPPAINSAPTAAPKYLDVQPASESTHPIDAVALESEHGVDYCKLRDLLKAGEWRKADEETLKVMLKAADRESQGWLDSDSLQNFPCKVLRTIDRLWVTASNGHFGFSVQKKIWEECGSPMAYNDDWKKFGDRVGWRKEGKWLLYSELKFSPEYSSDGELPVWDGFGFWVEALRVRGVVLFSRAKTCKL